MCALQDLSLSSPSRRRARDHRGRAEVGRAAGARNAVAEVGAMAVMALPLSSRDDSVGLLALLHNKTRAWPQTDAVVLKTLADQMVIALNNAGLRRSW